MASKLTGRFTILERPEVLAQIKETAEADGTTPSAWIRGQIRAGLRDEQARDLAGDTVAATGGD